MIILQQLLYIQIKIYDIKNIYKEYKIFIQLLLVLVLNT